MTVIAVLGPTAAGKSALSIALAHRLGGEVINADSMQLYQGMDIGTAKLTMAEREGVPHHLLDIWPVTQAASVAEYQTLARAEIDKVVGRGRTPILVGGSGLYVRAVLEDFEFPGTDSALRVSLEAELGIVGPDEMHRRLAALDPEAAARVFASGLDVTMVGLDVTNRAVLTPEHADRLRGSGRVGAAVAAMLDFYGRYYGEAYAHGGCPVHDALAVAHVARPGLLRMLDRHVEVDTAQGICRGRTVVDMRRRTVLPEPNARVAVDVDVPRFVDLLLDRLAKLPAEPAV